MKSLSIQYPRFYADNKQTKLNKNSQGVSTTYYHSNNVNFNGIFDVFKSDKNKFISKKEVLQKLKEIADVDEKDQEIILYITERIQRIYSLKKYYKYMVDKIVELVKEGFQIEDFLYYGIGHNNPQKFDAYMRRIDELKAINYPKKHVKYFLLEKNMDKKQAQLLLEMRQKGYEKRDILSYSTYDIEDEELDDLFLLHPLQVLKTIKILGKSGFVSTFNEKFDNVENNIANIGNISESHPLYQNLLELTNPRECEKYQKNLELIKELKSRFNITTDKATLIKNINDLTDMNKNIVENSIKEPMEKVKLAHIFNLMEEKIRPLQYILQNYDMTAKGSKHQVEKILDRAIRTDDNDIVCKQLNFRENKYLTKLFICDKGFAECYESMLEELNRSPNDSVEKIFYEIPLNRDTKAQFKKLGINFDNWVKADKKSVIQKEIKLKNEDRTKHVIRNLEADFSDALFSSIPQAEVDKLAKAMAEKAFTLRDCNVAKYDNSGFIDGINTETKLYKGEKPIQFEDLPALFKVLSNLMEKDNFWTSKNSDKTIDDAKNTIKNHILKMRYREMRSASQKMDSDTMLMTVRKVDMNDIEHALFLGNHAGCCTAVGLGSNQWTAPNYIMCKMISAIEVLDGKEPIGNTMCYIAEIDGKPSLVLDNIELQAKYQYNDEIRDAIFDCAQKIAEDIGKTDMPIYAGPNRHKVNMDNFPISNKDFRVIGSTSDGYLYFDFDAEGHTIDGREVFNSELYKIR